MGTSRGKTQASLFWKLAKELQCTDETDKSGLSSSGSQTCVFHTQLDHSSNHVLLGPTPRVSQLWEGHFWAFLISSWVMLIPLVPGPHFEKQGSRGLASPVSHHMLQIPTLTSWLLSRVQSLCWEDPLEEDTAALSLILAWRICWTEEPGRLWSTES